MSDKNKPMNDYIRQKAGYDLADDPEADDLKSAQKSTANAGSGTGAPPPAKRDMNDWIRARAALGGGK